MIDGVNPASAERTRLAWRRTDLAATVVVLLTGRLAVHGGLSALSTVGLVGALLGWIAMLWLTHRRIRVMAHPEPHVIGRTLPAIAFLIVGFALIGIALTVIN